MRVLLISGQSTHELSPSSLNDWVGYLANLLGDEVEIKATFLDKLVFDLSNEIFKITVPELDLDLQDIDFVFIRGPYLRDNTAYTYYVSRYCAIHNKPCANDYSLYYPGTKVSQAVIFNELNASFPRTIYSVNKQLMAEQAAQNFGYPYILKTNTGSHGDFNYLVKSEQELEEILKTDTDIDFLAQKFCPNDRDYRLLFVGNKSLLFERRGSSDTHLNNTSKGAVASKVEDTIPEFVVAKAKEIARYLKFSISGVDVMPNLETGEFVFLEVNSQPQLRTGALLEEKSQLLKDLFSEHE